MLILYGLLSHHVVGTIIIIIIIVVIIPCGQPCFGSWVCVLPTTRGSNWSVGSNLCLVVWNLVMDIWQEAKIAKRKRNTRQRKVTSRDLLRMLTFFWQQLRSAIKCKFRFRVAGKSQVRPVTVLPYGGRFKLVYRSFIHFIQFHQPLQGPTVLSYTESLTTHCISQYTVSRNTLYLAIHCISEYTVSHNTLYLSLHCISHYTVSHITLYLTLHCISHYTVSHTINK